LFGKLRLYGKETAMVTRALFIYAAIAWLAAPQTVRYEPGRAAVMHEQLRAVSTLQAAVVRGDLEALRAPALRLSELAAPPGLPEASVKHAQSINAAAREALAAHDATTAATATARILAACGSCHRSVGTMPALSTSSLPSVGGTVGHMLEHQRAIDQLLRGLVIPSDREWQAGARALRGSPLHARELQRDATFTPQLLRIEEAVHRLAEEAVATQMTENRVRIYSTLLARCADCHGLHRKIWGPPPE
jgi:mono/diheme cytochrome c family protein